MQQLFLWNCFSRCLLSGCSGIPSLWVLLFQRLWRWMAGTFRAVNDSISSMSKARGRMLLWGLLMIWQRIQIKLNSFKDFLDRSAVNFVYIHTHTLYTHTHAHTSTYTHTPYMYVHVSLYGQVCACVFVNMWMCVKENAVFSTYSFISTFHLCPPRWDPAFVHWTHLPLSSIVFYFTVFIPIIPVPPFLLVLMPILRNQLKYNLLNSFCPVWWKWLLFIPLL